MNRVGDDLLLASLEKQEDFIHEAADAIDVKAGLILAAAAVLSVQPAALLTIPNVSKYAFVAQGLGFIILCVGVLLAHHVLRIDGYESPGFDESWRDGIVTAAQSGSSEETIRGTIQWGLIEQAKRRVAKGSIT